MKDVSAVKSCDLYNMNLSMSDAIDLYVKFHSSCPHDLQYPEDPLQKDTLGTTVSCPLKGGVLISEGSNCIQVNARNFKSGMQKNGTLFKVSFNRRFTVSL